MGNTPHHECPGYDIKQSAGEAMMMQELWGMWSTPLLPSLPGPLCLSKVVPDKVLPMGQEELFEI